MKDNKKDFATFDFLEKKKICAMCWLKRHNHNLDIQEPHFFGFPFISDKTNLEVPLAHGFLRPCNSEEGGPPKVDMAFVIVVVVFTKSGEIIREESNVNQKTSKSFRLAKHCSA